LGRVVPQIEQTCSFCPSQWEGRTSDGHSIYIRYRWGCLKVYISEQVDGDALEGDVIFSARLADSLDGELGFEELKEATKHVLEFREATDE